ncbi:MAG: hypothetical protein OEX08_03180 [Candidatus Nomurabacteria bacterium]|nr:hypothetical protein [Candidatus Nomurabacteria bacterium]
MKNNILLLFVVLPVFIIWFILLSFTRGNIIYSFPVPFFLILFPVFFENYFLKKCLYLLYGGNRFKFSLAEKYYLEDWKNHNQTYLEAPAFRKKAYNQKASRVINIIIRKKLLDLNKNKDISKQMALS